MNLEALFTMASTVALVAWIALIAAPRWPFLLAAIRYGSIGLLCLAYTVLVMVYFYQVEGGGFNSLRQVRTLFSSDPVLLAGWLHYLAFDLFVGLAIAAGGDARGLSRFIQAPLLVTTFMFGPVGLLVSSVLSLAAPRAKPLTPQEHPCLPSQ